MGVAATRMQKILNGALKRAEMLADWSMTTHYGSEDHLRIEYFLDLSEWHTSTRLRLKRCYRPPYPYF
jgi:hypothetical protein